MKKTFKILSLGLAIMLCMSLGAFAGTQMENIWVEFNSVNLAVDGIPVSAPNILYDGTTYVPLRRTAEILGKEVGWNGATNTASISGGSSSGGAYTAKDMDNIKAATELINAFHAYYVFGSELYNRYFEVLTDYNNYKNGYSGNRKDLKATHIERFNECINNYNELVSWEKEILNDGKNIGLDLSFISSCLDHYGDAIDKIEKAYENINSFELSSNQNDLITTGDTIDSSFFALSYGQEKANEAYEKCFNYIINY